MLNRVLCVAGILALSGCGIAEYFDQHPANVRVMSDDDGAANAPASTESEIAPMTATAPQPAGAASPAAPESPQEPSAPTAPSAGAASQGATAVETQQTALPVAPSSAAEQPAPSPPAAPRGAPEQTSASEDCNAVAAARAADAAANGYGEDLQQVVHDKTYADCMAWNAAHR